MRYEIRNGVKRNGGENSLAVRNITLTLFVPRGVLPVPSLHQVWCCGCGHHAICSVCSCRRGVHGAARRDAVTGTTGWGHAHIVIVVSNVRAGLLRQFFVE
jgi:hypothetical protein